MHSTSNSEMIRLLGIEGGSGGIDLEGERLKTRRAEGKGTAEPSGIGHRQGLGRA